MPRPRTGLGQGLEALVPPLRKSPVAPFTNATNADAVWEVAVLRKTRRRRCRLTIAPSSILQPAECRTLKASTMLALGALGAAGWELTTVAGDRFYLKRPAPRQED